MFNLWHQFLLTRQEKVKKLSCWTRPTGWSIRGWWGGSCASVTNTLICFITSRRGFYWQLQCALQCNGWISTSLHCSMKSNEGHSRGPNPFTIIHWPERGERIGEAPIILMDNAKSDVWRTSHISRYPSPNSSPPLPLASYYLPRGPLPWLCTWNWIRICIFAVSHLRFGLRLK